jgi:RNA polymerase sigma-70 factor (ECF subfamily)
MAAGTLGNRAEAKGAPVSAAPASFSPPGIAAVYEEHFRYVWRCLRSLGVREASLDDALQDVFIVVQRRLPEFDGQGELRAWLYAIALRVAHKYWSRAHKDSARRTEELAESAAAPSVDLEQGAEQKQRLELARAALSALDDDKRTVFVLARIEQMSAPEIAEVLGIPLNTVYSRLRAAREAFETEVRRLQSLRRPPS